MSKVDLHVHSKYSDFASSWFLKAYQSPESFTEPELVYQQAKSRGMDFVTITDHDDIRGSLELNASHPEDTFVSCEVTSYFPEDNCKVHILTYGIGGEQYAHLMKIRHNLYDLREYIVEQNIAYSVAHATYDQDGKLEFSHIEKLVLLFDVFEVVNGGSSGQSSQLLHRYLQALDEKCIADLKSKHNILPMSDDPWIKGFTGGSDDHCGILIGSAYTSCLSGTIDQFLDSLRNKSTLANGLHGSFDIYATSVIKHIHDYRLDRDAKYTKSKMNDFLDMFFVGDQGNWVKRFKKSNSLRYLKYKNNRTHKALLNLLTDINQNRQLDIADKIPSAYLQVAQLHDEMFLSVLKALTKHLPSGDIFKCFQQLSTLFPLLLLAAPFVGSMRHQVLKSKLKQNLIEGCKKNYTEKTLWFTDTIDDLNGVSVSLRQIATQGFQLDYHLNLVTCVNEDNLQNSLPAGTVNLPPIYSTKAPGYEHQQINFPSLLLMMQKIVEQQPDKMIVSTPGPVGLGALLCAKLMNVPVMAVYHTDFAEQLLQSSGETALANMLDSVVNSFYKQFDTVFVPSKFYIDKLTDAGIDRAKMSLFPRSIDTQFYAPAQASSQAALRGNLRQNNLKAEFTLLFAGRISEDKNLSLLSEIIKLANLNHPGRYNLVIAGDGPYLPKLKSDLSHQQNIHFTGRIESSELVTWYQACDLLVFPSHTDTFGMVILEAQACGLPCIVTATGGPKEIIENNVTGQIIHTDNAADWLSTIEVYFRMKNTNQSAFQTVSDDCTNRVLANNSWQHIFDSLLGERSVIPEINQTMPELLAEQSESIAA